MTLQLIYKHQQQAHLQYISSLESVPVSYHTWTANNTPVLKASGKKVRDGTKATKNLLKMQNKNK